MDWTNEHIKLSERLIDSYVYAFFAANPGAVLYDKDVHRPDAIKQSISLLELQIVMIDSHMDMIGVGEVKDKSFYEEVIELMKTLREDGKN